MGVVAAELLAVRRRGIYECQRRGDALCRDVISLDCLIGRTPSGSYGLGALLLLNVDHQGAGHDAATGQRVGRVIEHAWHVASSRRVFRRIVSSAVGGQGARWWRLRIVEFATIGYFFRCLGSVSDALGPIG